MNTLQLRAGQTSQPFGIGVGATATIMPQAIGGGTGYFEYTFNSLSDVTNNAVTWLRWPSGAVSVTTVQTAFYPMLVRAVCTAGNITATIGDSTGSLRQQSIPWSGNSVNYVFDASGNFVGQSGPSGTGAAIAGMAWASRPTASTANAGQIIRFTDVGGGTGNLGGGNFFFSTGTRWKPLNGGLVLDAVDTPNASVANTTEQNLNPNHVVIPAGVIGDYDRLRLRVSLSKSGTSDTSTIQIKFGPLGTTADPAIATITSLATTSQTDAFLLDFKRVSATTIQKLGNASTDASYSGASGGAFPAAVTVANMNSTAMYLSITSTMTTGTETVTLQDMTLELYGTDSQ